jgi:hypothetical protein
MKVIPARMVGNCLECKKVARITGCPRDREGYPQGMDDMIQRMPPDCPLADAVEDPCHYPPELSCAKIFEGDGELCKSREIGQDWLTCPYGKEWSP